ncbi:MAG TPA: SURF1 family protein [Nitrococcus sp.]|nr:SURF1 family protein [Nitrococcus sp.]
MRISSYEFRPGFVPTLAVVLVLPLLTALGFWQIQRAKETQAYLHSLQAGRHAVAVNLNAGLPKYSTVHHQLVIAGGRYDSTHQFLLDNQPYEGRIGYHVLTPLRLSNGGPAVLVDRGWVDASLNRNILPDISVSEAERSVRGVVDKGPAVGIRLGQTYVGNGNWPQRIEYMDFSYIARSLPYQIAPYLIRLDPHAADGFIREPPKPAMGPEKNLGYAAQWFAMATAVVVIYILVNFKRRSHDD